MDSFIDKSGYITYNPFPENCLASFPDLLFSFLLPCLILNFFSFFSDADPKKESGYSYVNES